MEKPYITSSALAATARMGKEAFAERVVFKRFNDVTLLDGTGKEVQEVTRSYRPGRMFSLSLSYKS